MDSCTYTLDLDSRSIIHLDPRARYVTFVNLVKLKAFLLLRTNTYHTIQLVDIVLFFIAKVEDPSFPNTEGLTALHHSVCNSHDQIVKFLIEYGCDINAADMQGW